MVKSRCGDQLVNFADRHDRRQCFLLGHFDFLEHIPVAWAGGRVEKLQGAVSHFQRAWSEFSIIDQVQQIVGDLLLTELVWGEVEVAGQFANLTQVAIMGSFLPAEQLQVLAHPLPQRQGLSLFFSTGLFLFIVLSSK